VILIVRAAGRNETPHSKTRAGTCHPGATARLATTARRLLPTTLSFTATARC